MSYMWYHLTYVRHICHRYCMRTTLILPEGLVEQAREAIGFTSKTDTVTFALREVVRRSRVQDLKALIGTVTYDIDPTVLRQKDRTRMKRA